ncbi:MAG: bifunctional phosphoribosylaminoimidazolecarboxamide formyltransferase/IMP cyclohydrolase [Actinobacteria bacterium]|nr:bifunctional phosphoribosylaminoimidazolecarboxamide formyltransferase/IMP cyclohydrolase [Actinomycetota bacterium]MBU1943435.1 bifunctional phosphoribosylaminoimidazolecarboxamide formyltransferase/IMP cyclohydrolase [Actinomycetota bacterium]MBU2686792.1 bifunctional phosphoribosylaminoimidazolecarboxamide formyltransferase/IMP cyclohydrolase [Actinomycetota bacterium]
MPKVKRALLSVSDKDNIVWLARELEAMGVELISTGGTYKLLAGEDVKVTPVAEVTGFPEMLDGRVKTLHPKIHGGILADRSKPEHIRQLEYQKIPRIDLVVVNLYPFAATVARPGVTREEAIEQIDIGGPTMVRASAKNNEFVAIVVNPARYVSIVEEMKASGGEISRETCGELAREAFAHTADYDAMITAYLSAEAGEEGEFPRLLGPTFKKVSTLRYGENPHQSGALYAESGAVGASLATAPQIAGPALSFNNILDGEAAWQCCLEFERPACVIIKHNNPCGVAEATGPAEAYRKALDCDPVSAFGSVIAFNRPVDAPCARAMKGNFIELLLAPAFDDEALEILKVKKDLRILGMADSTGMQAAGLDMRRVHGGMLVQEYDTDPYDRAAWKVMSTVEPTEEQWADLLFAWRVCKHVKSNAIVLAKDGATVGVGAGQMSRVDSAGIAVEKAGEKAQGCVVASDAFFPFPDAVEKVVGAGAKAMIEPGGSKRDDEALAVCEANGVAMVFTGRRHFRH